MTTQQKRNTLNPSPKNSGLLLIPGKKHTFEQCVCVTAWEEAVGSLFILPLVFVPCGTGTVAAVGCVVVPIAPTDHGSTVADGRGLAGHGRTEHPRLVLSPSKLGRFWCCGPKER